MGQSEAYKLGRQHMDSFRRVYCKGTDVFFPKYTITKNSRVAMQSVSARNTDATYSEAIYRHNFSELKSDAAWEDFFAGLDV